MQRKIALLGVLIAGVLASAPASFAQFTPAPPDPLAGMRAAAAGNTQVCTNSETSACAQANPKILAAAMNSPVLAENLRALSAVAPGAGGAPGMDRAVTWAVTAFRAAGAETATAETGYADPVAAAGQKNVVAEIRGREKPDEFVLLAANLEDACNSALLVEAARDIHLTGLRPRRSIRFVLFGDKDLGSWAYVRRHRGELDRATAVVSFESGCGRVTGFALGGRRELEPGVHDALNFAPLASWGIAKDTYNASMADDAFDFVLEGVPSLTANRQKAAAASDAPPANETDLDVLKKNSAIGGILAFGLAEHAAPLGPRLSRMEVEALLKRAGLDSEMRKSDLWSRWESGQRGRQP